MEFNYLVCISLIPLAIIALFVFYKKFRSLFPATVQCWFCFYKTRVPYNSSNCWFCPSCEQYNGFKKDGSYNKTIPHQYDEKLNYNVSSLGRCKNGWRKGNSLCKMCNNNENIKISLLAEFVPLNEKNYEIEIEHYKKQLEKCYKLCKNCDKLLNNIFKIEREEFFIPRKLNTAIRRVLRIHGRIPLILNLFLSFGLSLHAYFQLENMPQLPAYLISSLKDYFQLIADSLPLKDLSAWYVSEVCTALDILISFGVLVNVIATYQICSPLTGLNSLSWFIIFFLNRFPDGLSYWIIIIQVVSGLISTLLSCHMLFSKVPVEIKSNVMPKFSAPTSPVTSTPKSSPMGNTDQSEKIIFKEPRLKMPVPKEKEDSLEPRIRGLTIGGNQSSRFSSTGSLSGWKSRMNQEQLDDFVSSSSFWGGSVCGGSTTNIFQATSAPFIKKRRSTVNNIISPPKFVMQSSRPSSTSSSGFASLDTSLPHSGRNIHTFPRPSEDCSSQQTSSMVCQHLVSYPPSMPVGYYYPPAQYNGFYMPSPTHLQQPHSENQRDNFSLLSQLYSLPIIGILLCNVTLLYTIYSKN